MRIAVATHARLPPTQEMSKQKKAPAPLSARAEPVIGLAGWGMPDDVL